MRAVERQAQQALPGEAPDAFQLFTLPNHSPTLRIGERTPVSTSR